MPNPARNLPNSPDAAGDGRVVPWPRDAAEARPVSPLLEPVEAFIATKGGGEGLFPTGIDGVNVLKVFERKLPMRQIYRPSLCIVVQGAKEILYGEEALRYGAMECLVVTLEMPATGRIVEAAPEKPYIGMTIELDVAMLRGVLEQLPARPTPTRSGPCLFVAPVEDGLAECVLRLLRLSATPQAIPILGPALLREICYWLLSGPYGGELCKLALPDTTVERIARAISLLHSGFAGTLRVEQLAAAAGMSASSFHQHFKALTFMTPVQFQKQLRLLEARRLMVTASASVAEAAYQVGYESASQFSREYSRMFGLAPKRDVLNLQRQYAAYLGRGAKPA